MAIVTGSATGLGAAIAVGLAKEGYCIVLNCAKSLAEAERVQAEIETTGVDAVVAPGNIGDEAACRAIAGAALTRFGRIDVLVNNAGTTKFVDQADLDGLSADDFLSIYRTNVVGAFQMVRACRDALAQRQDGAIVNISSLAGVTGSGSSIAYAASKGALNTMTLSLARTLAPAIRVNAVCPGFIATRFLTDRIDRKRYDEVYAHWATTTPLRQAGTPEAVAEAAIFFATPRSRHITGEMMIIDAGMHLGMAPLKAR